MFLYRLIYTEPVLPFQTTTERTHPCYYGPVREGLITPQPRTLTAVSKTRAGGGRALQILAHQGTPDPIKSPFNCHAYSIWCGGGRAPLGGPTA